MLYDLRHAVRRLLASPGFTVTVVATLALAIGANTAIFSVVNAAVFKPLPVPGADRLVRLFRIHQDGGEDGPFSFLDYRDVRESADVFSDLVAFTMTPMSLDMAGGSESRMGQVVSGNYFQTLRATAAMGRLLTPADDRVPGAHPVVVLSDRYWRQAMGADPAVVGSAVSIGGLPYTVVGVTQPGFVGAMPVPAPDLWAPLAMFEELRPEIRGRMAQRRTAFLFVLGRLAPEVGPEQAQAGLDAVSARLREVDPERDDAVRMQVLPATGIIPMTPHMRRVALALSGLVMALVGVVLVVGCANVANLLLARALARRHELGIRLALGAPRRRLVQQLLVECLVLAALGGLAGLTLAGWVTRAMVATLPELPFNLALELDLGLDWRVLVFTGAAVALAGVSVGLLPALGSARSDPVTSLSSARGGGGHGRGHALARSALVVGQVAGSLMLLVVAGLFVRSLSLATSMNPGFDHDRVLEVTIDSGAHESDPAERVELYRQLRERLRALPGVEYASLDSCPPLTLSRLTEAFWIEGRDAAPGGDELVSVAFSQVTPDYFETLGIPILRGRAFADGDDSGAPLVAVVNQAFVDQYWSGQEPIGRRVRVGGADRPDITVVGVTATAKYWQVGEAPRPYLYLAMSQVPSHSMVAMLLRTRGDPLTVAGAANAAIRELDQDISVSSTNTLSEMIGFNLLPARLAAATFGGFGLLALVMAAVGLYGVMAQAVGQRTHEIGIRAALGARTAELMRMVLTDGIRLTAIGVVLGLAVSALLTRTVAGLLYAVHPLDWVTFLAVTAVLAAVAMLACWVPARRAARVDPVVALRSE